MPHQFEAPKRGIKFEEYVRVVGEGDILSRADFQELMAASYSTVVYHVERAVKAGLLNKQYGFISLQPGWLYALPATMPRLEGI